jgi:hypothetical protein
MKPRILRLVPLALVALAVAAAVVALRPVPARSDTSTTPFSGAVTEAACGSTDFTVGADMAIDVTMSAEVASNDLMVNLVHGGIVVANTDSGVGQENLAYRTPDAGTYAVQICKSSNPATPFLPPGGPYAYDGTFTTTEAPLPVPPGSTPGTNGIAPTASYGAWNARFAASTVVDPQRTEGEPLTFVDADGNQWESGPWGFSTNMSFIHRSTNGGKDFHLVSVIGARSDAPPGGGDTDVAVDDQGNVYFVDLEGPLLALGTSVSNDGGNSWRKNPVAVPQTTVDRQWLALDNGSTSGAVDDTIFLAFHETSVGTFIYSSPGSQGASDSTGGLVWQNSGDGTSPLQPLAADAICAQLRFDPVKRNLYYACSESDHIRVTVGHVGAGQRTGIAYHNYTAPRTPSGVVSGLFPALATDRAGNVYVAWIDKMNSNLYYAFSTDGGQTWSAPVQVNSWPAVTNEFDWAQGGAPGTLALAWYGTDRTAPNGSDGMPSTLSSATFGAATSYPWYGYAALVTAANTAKPKISQTRFTSKPMHYGNICNSGLGCTTSTTADRQMADFFGFTLGQDGALRIVYDDTTNDFDDASLFATRQISGTTPLGTAANQKAAANPVADDAGDAQWPHYAPTGPGQSLPQLDLTKLRVSNPNSSTLRVQMQVQGDPSTALPPAGKAAGVWLTRFQALSPRPGGTEDIYRVFYVLMEKRAGVPPAFYVGTATCQSTTPNNCKILQYPDQRPVTGQIAGSTITIDVGMRTGFGSPIDGKTLHNVTAFTLGRDSDVDDLSADVDATPAFDYQVGSAK